MRFDIIAISLLLSQLVTASVLKKRSPKYVSLPFDKSRGSTYEESSKHNKPYAVLSKRDDGFQEIELKNQVSFFSVELEIGTPRQNVTVLVDTGSSDLWVTGSNNPYCRAGSVGNRRNDASSGSGSGSGSSNNKKRVNIKRDEISSVRSWLTASGTNTRTQSGSASATRANSLSSALATIDCSQYGTFNTSASSTFSSNDTLFVIFYGDSSYAYGTWGQDELYLHDIDIGGLSFAVANQTNSTVGVLGIGLPGLEVTYSGYASSARNRYQYDNFPLILKRNNVIKANAYSLFLNSTNSSSGSLLFGAVDHSKYSGQLYTVPLLNTLESSGYTDPIQFEVAVQGIGVRTSGSNTTLTTTVIPALLDSGATLSYFPVQVAEMIADALDATYSSSYGYYIVDCPSSDDDTEIIYDFGGFHIASKLTDYILTTNRPSICVLGIVPQNSNRFILGDVFLTSAYVVYDLDNFEISLAQANYEGGDEQIEVISESVPSAIKAPSYSSTRFSSASASTGGDIFTVTGSNTTSSSAPRTSIGSQVSPSTYIIIAGFLLASLSAFLL